MKLAPERMLGTLEGTKVAIDAWLQEGGNDLLAEKVYQLAVQNGVVEGLGLSVVLALGQAVGEMLQPASRGTDEERRARALALYEPAIDRLAAMLVSRAEDLPPPGLYRAQCEGWLALMGVVRLLYDSSYTNTPDPPTRRLSARLYVRDGDHPRCFLLPSDEEMTVGWKHPGHTNLREDFPIGWSDLPSEERAELCRVLPGVLAWKYDGAPAPWGG